MYDLVRERINNRVDKKRIFLIILYSKEKNDYTKIKKYLLQHNIPSQFLNMDDKSIWYKTKNLIPEILTKAGICPFIFPEEISKVDGYICLSDIHNEHKPLFGINITYNSEKNVFKNSVKVYSDIYFKSNKYRIDFNNHLGKLLEKIVVLGSELIGKKVNIYLTKYWKSKEVYLMIDRLYKEGIEVKKIFYISFFSDKFIFKGADLLDVTKIPYLIKDNFLAYLQPNTRIGLFGSLFPISLELANIKSNEVISRDDIEEYLWLIKRRVYRLQYIDMLRYPEFIKYVRKLKELNLSVEDFSKLTFNGDLLI